MARQGSRRRGGRKGSETGGTEQRGERQRGGDEAGGERPRRGIQTRLCKTIEAVRGEQCIITDFLGPNPTDHTYAAYMRKILDEGARVTQQLAADGAAADPTNTEKRDRAEKYRCPARCRLYFRGTITVDGYCEQGAGEAVLSGRLCKYDGHIECLEITIIN